MPIIKSAKKALRQTHKRTALNKSQKNALRTEVKKFKDNKSPESLSGIFSSIDKVAKKGIFHKNKAARLKSRLAKMLS